MSLWWLVPSVAVFSTTLTGIFRRYALARSVLDLPNDRSLHTIPMPRGGGIAIVLAFLAAVAWLSASDILQLDVTAALIGSGAAVAFVGFLDDHRPIAAGWRLLAHFCSAAWALSWLGGLPPLRLLSVSVNLGWFGHILAAIYVVWLINLYNFMDGIDGIAGIEAITVSLGITLLCSFVSATVPDSLLPALLAMSALGFLVWNWPPAKIFMGDAGSGFLGLMFGVMSIMAAWQRPEFLWSWVILLGVFIVDATVTLLRRVHRGEKPYQPHRNHAYQHAARILGSHQPVSLIVGAINVFWLLPLAIMVGLGWMAGLLGLLIAYTPIVCLVIRYKAGAIPATPLNENARV